MVDLVGVNFFNERDSESSGTITDSQLHRTSNLIGTNKLCAKTPDFKFNNRLMQKIKNTQIIQDFCEW